MMPLDAKLSSNSTISPSAILRFPSLRCTMRNGQRYVAQIPKWRHPLLGYLMSVPVVGLALLGVLLVQYFLKVFSFPGVSMFLAVVLIALIWGVGPALFSVLLSTLALDYFYLSPAGHLDITSGPGLLQLLPFIVSGIFIAIITAQRE